MATRRVEQLVSQVRRQTENERAPGSTGSQDGISDEDFIQFLNDGKERIEGLINKTHQRLFTKETILDLVANQEAYDLPFDTFAGHTIVNVEYSFSIDDGDFIPLRRGKNIERSTFNGYPSFYIPRGKQILINPIPEGSYGRIRINYTESTPTLDKRRGVIDVVTLDPLTRTITELSVDASGAVTFNSEDFKLNDFITIVDRYGNQRMRRIPITDVDAGGVITVASDFVYELGETAASGDYVLLGANASSVYELEVTEKYLLAYCAWKILKRDSSLDSTEQEAELQAMEREIVDSFAEISEDIDHIPIINTDYLW